jgi:hypothetical protein
VPPEETHMHRSDTALAHGEERMQSAEPTGPMIRVPIESKLGLGPSEPHPAKESSEQTPIRRARSHRRQP